MKQAMNQSAPDIFRYEPEDMEQRDESAEIADLEQKLERHTGAVAAKLRQARAEFARGEYFTLEQVTSDIDAQRLRRRQAKRKLPAE
jgi:hypothetical protein